MVLYLFAVIREKPDHFINKSSKKCIADTTYLISKENGKILLAYQGALNLLAHKNVVLFSQSLTKFFLVTTKKTI